MEGGQASCFVVQQAVELPQVAGSYLLVKNIPLMPNYSIAAPTATTLSESEYLILTL